MQNKLSTYTCITSLVLKQNRKSVMNTTNWPEGIKKTKQREAIWSVLTTTDKPITAMEIAERLGDGSTTWMPLCSVYKMWSHDTSAHMPCCRNATGIN